MNQIKKEFSAITVDHVEPHTFKPEQSQAQIRQVVTTTYPSQVVGNSATDSLFDIKEFKLKDGQSFSSKRVAWIPVPNGTSVEQVKKILSTLPRARIYRMISNELDDVLTEEQKQAHGSGLVDLETLENGRRVCDSNGDPVSPEQFFQNFFTKDYTSLSETDENGDYDYRTQKKSVVAKETSLLSGV